MTNWTAFRSAVSRDSTVIGADASGASALSKLNVRVAGDERSEPPAANAGGELKLDPSHPTSRLSLDDALGHSHAEVP
jgi:hypothetical protein